MCSAMSQRHMPLLCRQGHQDLHSRILTETTRVNKSVVTPHTLSHTGP